MEQLTCMNRDAWKLVQNNETEAIADHNDYGRIYLCKGADSRGAASWYLGAAYRVDVNTTLLTVNREKTRTLAERFVRFGTTAGHDFYEQVFAEQVDILAALLRLV